MPKANRIWTINDIGGGDGGGVSQDDADDDKSTFAAAPTNNAVKPAVVSALNPWASNSAPPMAASYSNAAGSTPPPTIKCLNLPSLSRSMQARYLLERILAEFLPIIQRRNYNVKSISEFCCCGDGLDHEPGSRRKRPKQPSNLLGYNYTSKTRYGGQWNKSHHTIHLRLRQPTNHNILMLYEDVAGTMAHELAHCEIGPHNDAFNKLMDEIIDEHASLIASKLTRNGGLPMLPFVGTTGHVLGGDASLSMAVARQKQQLQSTGHVLGGDKEFTNWMSPKELAVAAADARRRQEQMRLRGALCCRPCVEETDDGAFVVSCNGGSGASFVEADGGKKRPSAIPVLDNVENRKPRAKTSTAMDGKRNGSVAALATLDLIDLTGDEDDDEVARTCYKTMPSNKVWQCSKCTFMNEPVVAACFICLAERDQNTLH